MTRHHITSHDMTCCNYLTTLPHLTPNHDQPHYFISPRSQPHDITYHSTAHYITTTDTPRKHNQPPKRHHQTERLKAGAHKKLGLGIALAGRLAHILISKFFLWFGLQFFFRPGTMLWKAVKGIQKLCVPEILQLTQSDRTSS